MTIIFEISSYCYYFYISIITCKYGAKYPTGTNYDRGIIIIIFKLYQANSQASTQTLKYRREDNGLQRTSWQRKYLDKKPRK